MIYKKYALNAEEAKKLDIETQRVIGIDAIVLMERAALGALNEIKALFPIKGGRRKGLIVCGTGNNGADGLALARLLIEEHYDISVLFPDEGKHSLLFDKQLAILNNYDVTILNSYPVSSNDFIVDAIFGIGLNRPIEGIYLSYIKEINKSDSFVISLDVPSGINTDNGKVMGDAVFSDLTITFGYLKRGMLFYPGKKYSGRHVCIDIGINAGLLDYKPNCFYYDYENIIDAASLLPERDMGGNKGSFGKVLVIAGSQEISGAAVLACESAFRIGSGMVKIFTHEVNREILATRIPEVMISTYNYLDDFPWDKLKESLNWCDSILIGPGLGCNSIASELLERILTDAGKNLVIDADAINIISSNESLQKTLKERINKFPNIITVITPHLGEMSRLIKCSVEEIKDDLVAVANNCSQEYGICTVLKDARTVVSYRRNQTFINTSGNDGMATAGSGDVLAGILAGLLAGGGDGFNLVISGVAIHACCGDLAAKDMGRHSMMASDIINKIVHFSTMNERL